MKKNSLSLALARLESLSPMAILKRGYAVIKAVPTGQMVRSVDELKSDDMIEAVLADGSVTANVIELKKGKKG